MTEGPWWCNTNYKLSVYFLAGAAVALLTFIVPLSRVHLRTTQWSSAYHVWYSGVSCHLFVPRENDTKSKHSCHRLFISFTSISARPTADTIAIATTVARAAPLQFKLCACIHTTEDTCPQALYELGNESPTFVRQVRHICMETRPTACSSTCSLDTQALQTT